MQIISQFAPLPLAQPEKGTAVAMGFFDGIHIGHRAVIESAVQWAKEHDAAPAVFTFKLPMVNKMKGKRLLSTADKHALIASLGVEYYLTPDFEEIKGLTPEQFVLGIVRDCNARALVCGENFTFGAKAAGNPELLRTLKPGRVAAIHVKDRVEFANVTGLAAPTIEPFHADCIAHFRKHGFAYFGMITVVTDVVRENNQTYRLGWTEQCKDGTKMGVGCPEYILLFRKLPTDCSRGYADTPVKKSKEEYTRAQWQIDAHAFWRSSGDRPFTREELEKIPASKLQSVYRKFSRNSVYSYEEHVKLAESLDKDGRLPSTFMVVAPGSWDMTVWDDIVRMKTLNTSQSQRRQNLHVCPLQIDIVQRLIERYSNEGELVADPFAGLFTVPYEAVKMNRKGKGVELNPDYFRDGVGYLESADAEKDAPTLFDLLENGD